MIAALKPPARRETVERSSDAPVALMTSYLPQMNRTPIILAASLIVAGALVVCGCLIRDGLLALSAQLRDKPVPTEIKLGVDTHTFGTRLSDTLVLDGDTKVTDGTVSPTSPVTKPIDAGR